MGNCCSTTKTPILELQKDANMGTYCVNDNLLQNSEENGQGPMTGFFQTAGKKIPPEGMQNNAENRLEAGSNKAVAYLNFVQENDGLEMTDVQ